MLTTKLTLVLAAVILTTSLTLNIYLAAHLSILAIDNNSVQKQIEDFSGQIIDLQSEKSTLQDQLQTQQNNTNSPILVTRLGAKDIRASPYANHPWSGRIRFYLSGEVWNAGKLPAYNCRLHVVLYQGANVANNTYVMLGTINPGSYADVSANVYYEGDALTSWKITPETG